MEAVIIDLRQPAGELVREVGIAEEGAAVEEAAPEVAARAGERP